MTPEEVSKAASELQHDLKMLSREEIGMSNYKRIMATYQRLLNDLIVCVRELANSLIGGNKNG